MKSILLIIGAVGVLIYSAIFALTYGVPESVESSAKGFVKAQIAEEVKEKYDASALASISDKAFSIASKLGFEEAKIKENLKNDLPKKIAEVIGSMCGYDCEKKKEIAASITKSYVDRIANIQIAHNSLDQIIKGKYLEIVGKLKLDVRIFLGSNATVFLLILLLSLMKPVAVSHLFLPGILLCVSSILASSIYIFGQDWFYTILYNDYVGFGYLAYIGVIFGFLIDIAMNKARVTTELLNAFFNAIGSALQVAPC